MVEDAEEEEDARFVASASKQTKTEGFGVPRVLRDFVSTRTACRCLIFSTHARGLLPEKKMPRLYPYAKRGLFQSHPRRLKRARALFPPCEGVELILGFLTFKWMSSSVIRIRKREIFTFYMSIRRIFWK